MKNFLEHLFNRKSPPAAAKTDAAAAFLEARGIVFTKRADGTLFVPGDLSLASQQLTALPDLSRVEVGGSFCCDDNALETLEGAPQKVGRNFSCMGNRLITLRGAPPQVPGDFNCARNLLASLAQGPDIVGGDFHCGFNKLETLEQGPSRVAYQYVCVGNRLPNLKGIAQSIGEEINARENPLETVDGVAENFAGLFCRLGDFGSFAAVPEELRLSRESRNKEAALAAMSLPEDLKLMRAITFASRPAQKSPLSP